MFRSLFCLLQENPAAGMKGTLGGLVAGTTPTIINIPRSDVIFWFQVVAFTVTIIAGILTAYATTKKIRKKKIRKK